MSAAFQRTERGVSLIELIIVIVAVTVGLLALGNAYLAPASSIATNQDIQATWQVAQACADFTLGRIRRPGAFSNVTSDPCGAAGANLATNGTTRTVTVTNPANCLGTAFSCRQFVISVTRNGYTASITFMVYDS
jgi:Tfp pilus assembly protein PilV